MEDRRERCPGVRRHSAVCLHFNAAVCLYLKSEREEDVVLAFALLQFLEILSQRRVRIDSCDFHVPLVQRVVDQFDLSKT